jgi:hypothetical protein
MSADPDSPGSALPMNHDRQSLPSPVLLAPLKQCHMHRSWVCPLHLNPIASLRHPSAWCPEDHPLSRFSQAMSPPVRTSQPPCLPASALSTASGLTRPTLPSPFALLRRDHQDAPNPCSWPPARRPTRSCLRIPRGALPTHAFARAALPRVIRATPLVGPGPYPQPLSSASSAKMTMPWPRTGTPKRPVFPLISSCFVQSKPFLPFRNATHELDRNFRRFPNRRHGISHPFASCWSTCGPGNGIQMPGAIWDRVVRAPRTGTNHEVRPKDRENPYRPVLLKGSGFPWGGHAMCTPSREMDSRRIRTLSPSNA